MDAQIEQLRHMSLDQLRETWIRSFGEAPARWAAAATIEGIVEHQVIALLPDRDRQRGLSCRSRIGWHGFVISCDASP